MYPVFRVRDTVDKTPKTELLDNFLREPATLKIRMLVVQALQFEVERQLKASVQRTGARSGTVIVMNAVSGEILALANQPSFNLNDKGEMETVDKTRSLVAQTLATIDPDKVVNVSASGSMGYADWGTKDKPYQSVDLKIAPIHFSV